MKTIVPILVLILSIPSLAAVRVNGNVTTADGSYATGISIAVSSVAPAFRTTIPVAANGRFNQELEFDGTHLTFDVTARSYVTFRKVVLVQDGVANAGTIPLERDRSLKVEAISRSVSADTTCQHFDLVFSNDRKSSVVVTEIRLLAARQRHSDCGDPTPAVVYRIVPSSSSGWELTIVTPRSNTFDKPVQVVAQLELIGCKNHRMNVVLPHSFPLDASERMKMRISLPTQDERTQTILDLDTWESVVFLFRLSDGTEFTQTWQR